MNATDGKTYCSRCNEVSEDCQCDSNHHLLTEEDIRNGIKAGVFTHPIGGVVVDTTGDDILRFFKTKQEAADYIFDQRMVGLKAEWNVV